MYVYEYELRTFIFYVHFYFSKVEITLGLTPFIIHRWKGQGSSYTYTTEQVQ